MTDYSNLEAGPATDALVAEKVMGWPEYRGPDDHGADTPICWARARSPRNKAGVLTLWYAPSRDTDGAIWSPSTDITAAWELIEKVYSLGRGWMLVTRRHDNLYVAYQRTDLVAYDSGDWHDYADTAPLAICRAALAAVEKGEPK